MQPATYYRIGRVTKRHYYIEQISSAGQTIEIRCNHLRSRPIARQILVDLIDTDCAAGCPAAEWPEPDNHSHK